MKVCARRFNVYLALAAVLVFLCGCKTEQQRERDKAGKVVGALRVHIEASPSDAGTTQTISVLRSDPVLVTIANEPILTEANLIAAKVINTPGGFAIEVRFDEISASLLEQYSAANPGRHFAIFGQWGEKLNDGRWLAAPFITHRISDGTLAFTPDCSRAEADQLVLGLNNVAAKINKGSLK
jgi:preprotein translocase subunit SecD